MKRLTWKKPNGSWGIDGVDLAALPPHAYGAVYKLLKLEDAMEQLLAAPALKACCAVACGRSDDGTRAECDDCPIRMSAVTLQATSAELAGVTYSYERALDECRLRGAEINRLKRELMQCTEKVTEVYSP